MGDDAPAAPAPDVLFRSEFARETTCEGGRDGFERVEVDESEGTPDTRRESAGEGGAGRLENSDGEEVEVEEVGSADEAKEVESGRLRLVLLKVLNAGLEGELAPFRLVRPASRLLGMKISAGYSSSCRILVFVVAVVGVVGIVGGGNSGFAVSGMGASSGGKADVWIVGVVEEDVDPSAPGDRGGSSVPLLLPV